MAENKRNKAETKTNMSKSKTKREERKKQVQRAQQQKRITKIVSIAVTAVIVVALAYVIGRQIYILAIRTTPSQDFGAGLTADGMIEGVTASSMVTLPDYENISIPEEEVAATEEEVDNRINSVLSSHKEMDTDANRAVADGDEVNIDFTGTIDGEEFDGGQGTGYQLTIGSGSFIDDFEQQLIGHKPGEDVTVEATFPDDYENTQLAGKEASFAVTVNGIMVTPELTDEFVAENLAESEGVETAEEYRAKIENDFYETHLTQYLTNYIVENTTVNTYPKAYVKVVKSLLKYSDSVTSQIKDEIAYEKELTSRAQENVKSDLAYQAVFEKAGLTFDAEAYFAEMAEQSGEDYVNSLKEYYGEAYIAQNQVRQLVAEYLTGLYTS